MNFFDIKNFIDERIKPDDFRMPVNLHELVRLMSNEILINVNGDLLPIENVRIKDDKTILIISASAL